MIHPRPVLRRTQADADVLAALDYYSEQSVTAAAGFLDALEAAVRHVGQAPASGSPRYGHELRLPGLHSWGLGGYPWTLFCFEQPTHIEIWRLLHQQRDIPASRRAPDQDPA